MKLFLSAVLTLALLAPAPLAAQDDRALYMENAGAAAILYRGHRATVYPMAYNGTYFWSGPAFTAGSVRYGGRNYDNLRLNIDAARQDLLVKSTESGMDKVLQQEFVERFVMDGRLFLNLRQLYGPDAPDGYWEVIYDGRAKLVKQISRTLKKDADGTLWAQTAYDDTASDNSGPRALMTFVRTVRYCYISETGDISPVRKRSEILRHYKEQKREISRHISRLESSGRMDFERFTAEALRYAETR